MLDFYCGAAKLGIEVDGIAHAMGDQSDCDAARDGFLKQQGIEIIRIAASDVLASPGEVAETLVALCRAQPHP